MFSRTDSVLGVKDRMGGHIIGPQVASLHQIFAQSFEGGYLFGGRGAHFEITYQANTNTGLVG